MAYRPNTLYIAILLGLALFQYGGSQIGLSKPTPEKDSAATIIIAPSIQVLLYGGERYLAANIETVRALHSFGSEGMNEHVFRLRGHLAASELNPCNEDNYWIGNANLSWGGDAQAGLLLLSNARDCRFWDEWPAFFYGFNQYFFNRNIDAAYENLNLAAERTKEEQNATLFKSFAIMLRSKEQPDITLALQFLKSQRDQTTDKGLRSGLDSRIQRLEGLVTLRNAQKQYESQYKRPLKNVRELIESGILRNIPSDPLGIGYEFRDQTFHLRQLRLQ